MKQAISIAAVLVMALTFSACSGGGGTAGPDAQAGPLKINFVAASPVSGASPLRVALTANISGGVAPYFYAWDFTNDGSFDVYRNNEFLQTLSVQHDYFLLAGDGTDTVYQAVLRVTDSENNVVLSTPVTVTVNADGGLLIYEVLVFSDEQSPGGEFVLRSGESVYFQPAVDGGNQPYSYQWDFDGNGSVDSTLPNPEYTFTYGGAGAKVFVVKLKLIDSKGQAVLRDILVAVEGSGNTGDPGGGGGSTGFSIVLNSNPPADSNGNIILDWDASANNPNMPFEPKLDLAVVVSGGGRAPFEYYWDFEDDGVFDSQALSPTVPYYDAQRKILVNPYLHLEKSKIYKLRVFVIDSSGRMEQATRNIISNNQENVSGKLLVTGTYGAASGGSFTANPPLPYSQVSGPLGSTEILFRVDASGSTAAYDWQIDVDGDGIADWPSLAEAPSGFSPLTAGTASKSIIFGFYDDGGAQVSDFPALGYYAASATVRSINPATQQPVETFKVQMPVSLVRRDNIETTGGPALLNRSGMVLMGQAADAAAGANGNYIPSRRVVIAGGNTGTTPLNDVQEVVQVFDEPGAPNTLEVALASDVAGRLPLNQPRGGSVGVTNGTDCFVIGGKNIDNGILGTCETASFALNSAWGIAGEIRVPAYLPLTRPAGTYLPVTVNGIGPGYFFAGGLTPSGAVESVSNRLIFTDLQDANPNVNGIQLGFGTVGGGMVTPRYDAAMAFASNRLYVIGGRVASGRSVSTVEAFNLITGQWENIASLKEFRSGTQAQVIDGIIYVHGGAFYPGNDLPGGGAGSGNRAIVASSECFNPLTGVWSYTVGLPANAATEHGGSAALAGSGSAASLPALLNQIWYHGGANAAGADTNGLYEFTYFYTITPTP